MGEQEDRITPLPRLALAGDFDDGSGAGRRLAGPFSIAFVSGATGSGKTALAAHLSVQAEMAGAGPVAVIDTDPEGALADWWNRRQEEFPAFRQTTAPLLADDFRRLRSPGVRACIVDTPAGTPCDLEQIVAAVDIVAIPSGDPRSAGSVAALAQRLRTGLFFVINAARPQARITAEAAIALSQHGTLAPVTVHHRADFASSMEAGQTAMEADPKGAAAGEIRELWRYIAERVGQAFR